MQLLCERNNTEKPEEKAKEATATINKLENDNGEREKVSEEQKLLDDEEKLVTLLEQRLQFLLRSLTKLFLSKSPVHNKKEYVIREMTYNFSRIKWTNYVLALRCTFNVSLAMEL